MIQRSPLFFISVQKTSLKKCREEYGRYRLDKACSSNLVGLGHWKNDLGNTFEHQLSCYLQEGRKKNKIK